MILIALVTFLLACVDSSQAAQANQQAVSKATVLEWVKRHREAKSTFQPGETLKSADLEKLRPFLPPGYFEEYAFPEVEFVTTPTGEYPPHHVYQAATEQFAAQTRLAEDGALVGYVAGQPFPNDTLDPADPTSGLKAAWNFNFRWQHYGQRAQRYVYLFMRRGGSHSLPKNLPQDMITGGGGTIERVIWQRFQRVYFTHVSMHPEANYLFPAPDASQFEYKDYVEFLDPYDVRGQRMVILRSADPHQADQAWMYVPSLRKVRRFSAEEKSDSFVGSDGTLDDFYGFSGRPLDYDWKFHGWKTVIHTMNAHPAYPHYYGPNGWLPFDRWELRNCVVVEQIPKDPNHPYSAKLLFWDAQTYRTAIALAFDRDDKLWKIWQPQISWSEDVNLQPNPYQGTYVARYTGGPTIDIKNGQATLFVTFNADYPAVAPDDIDGLFDLNKLTEGRR